MLESSYKQKNIMTTTNTNVRYADAVLQYPAFPLINNVRLNSCVALAKTLQNYRVISLVSLLSESVLQGL
jgi:hypothetical protein